MLEYVISVIYYLLWYKNLRLWTIFLQAAREEREARRKADIERKKQEAAEKREREKRAIEAARQREHQMLMNIASAEERRKMAEEERLRKEQAEEEEEMIRQQVGSLRCFLKNDSIEILFHRRLLYQPCITKLIKPDIFLYPRLMKDERATYSVWSFPIQFET